MTQTNYGIDAEGGWTITVSLPARTARRTAQREADERNEPVYLYEMGVEPCEHPRMESGTCMECGDRCSCDEVETDGCAIHGAHSGQERIEPSEIEVELGGPVGPRVTYGAHDEATVEANIPDGWEVDWSNAVDISTSGTHRIRYAAPLRKLAQLYFGCSDSNLGHDAWLDVFADLAAHLKSTADEDLYGSDWTEADEGCQITAPVARIEKIAAAIKAFAGPVYCEVQDAS